MILPEPTTTAAGPFPAALVHDLRVDVLVPIDLDFEPDLDHLLAEQSAFARVQPGPGGAPAIETQRATLGHVSLDGEVVGAEAMVATRIYGFGTGIVRVSFQREHWDLLALTRVAAATEQLKVGEKTVLELASAIREDARARLRPYARACYETLIPTSEAYPVFRVGGLDERGPSGDAFVEAERRALTAIVGVPGRGTARLSAFAFDTARIRNMSALEDDVVLVREAGGFLHLSPGPRGGSRAASDDAKKVEGLVELAYAQYWALRSVDALIQRLQTEAYSFIARLQERGSGGLVPMRDVLSRLYRAREEHMAVAAIVDDFLELPAIGYDIYLDAVFREVQRVFGVAERSRLARDRLEDLERSFEISHQIISERRLLTIELLVLLVIVLELVLALVQPHK